MSTAPRLIRHATDLLFYEYYIGTAFGIMLTLASMQIPENWVLAISIARVTVMIPVSHVYKGVLWNAAMGVFTKGSWGMHRWECCMALCYVVCVADSMLAFPTLTCVLL